MISVGKRSSRPMRVTRSRLSSVVRIPQEPVPQVLKQRGRVNDPLGREPLADPTRPTGLDLAHAVQPKLTLVSQPDELRGGGLDSSRAPR